MYAIHTVIVRELTVTFGLHPEINFVLRGMRCAVSTKFCFRTGNTKKKKRISKKEMNRSTTVTTHKKILDQEECSWMDVLEKCFKHTLIFPTLQQGWNKD